jgi:hypothetical protein
VLAVVVFVSVAGASLLGPALAPAAFTRPFLCATPGAPVLNFKGITAGSEDRVWVSEAQNEVPESVPAVGVSEVRQLEIGPSCGSSGKLTEGAPIDIEGQTKALRVAFDAATEQFVITGQTWDVRDGYLEWYDSTGGLVRRSAHRFGANAYVASDLSTEPLDPLAGSLALAHNADPAEPEGDGRGSGVARFTSAGAPLGFTNVASGKGCAKYIEDEQIAGTEEECFVGGGARPEAIAVDTHGDVFAVVTDTASSKTRGVYEYDATGKFVRAFTGASTPGLKVDKKAYGGFGGAPNGVAVDPTNGDLLISIDSDGGIEGAIDEFSASGRFLSQITATTGGGHLVAPGQIAVSELGELFVTDNIPRGEGQFEGRVYAYGPGAALPTLKQHEPSERTSTAITLEAEVGPEGEAITSCEFEYVTSNQFEASGFGSATKAGCEPPANEIPVDSEFHLVKAHVTGLVPGTRYDYRLVAATSSGVARTEPQAFTVFAPPKVESVSATNVTSEYADLNAKIAPLGSDTTYHFEYVDAAHYASGALDPFEAAASTPSADAGSGGVTGGTLASVQQQIGGLSPETTYYVRAVAENEVEGEKNVVPGEAITFTTLAAVVPGPPDGRTYELVTPRAKSGAADLFGHSLVGGDYVNNDIGYPSGDGRSFLLETLAAFGPFPASAQNVYVFRRHPTSGEDPISGGWAFQALASPQLGVQSITGVVATPSDLSSVGITDTSGSAANTAGEKQISLVGAPGGPYVTLHTDAPLREGQAVTEGTFVAGASHDLKTVVLESKSGQLCPAGGVQDAGAETLCEWNGSYETTGEGVVPALRPVNVDDEGNLLSHCGAVLGLGVSIGTGHNAVSSDGSKVVFTAPDPEDSNGGSGCWQPEAKPQVNPPQLYLRDGGETIELSAPDPGVVDPTGLHPAQYAGAAEDGSRVFFVTEGELTPEAKELQLHDSELYEYNVGTRSLRLASAGNPGSPAHQVGVGAHLNTVPAVSADGSAVYFTAFGRLTADAPALSGPEVALYRYDAITAEVKYVATVEDTDYPGDDSLSWTTPKEFALVSVADWSTTPDGRYLLFGTTKALKEGYSTAGDCTLPLRNSAVNGHCVELYRYDSLDGKIVCISCNPSGASPESDARFSRSASAFTLSAPPQRAVSASGEYAFFDTADALVTQDSNHTLDVYEWHNGRVSLISSGKDPAPSFFLGTSSDGSNVFFGTHAQMTREDTDVNGDIYDARICTPTDRCISPPSSGESVQCEGDACQSHPGAPSDLTPGTMNFSGTGNFAPGSSGPESGKKLSTAQKLAKALKACRRMKHNKAKRRKCEASARRHYGKAARKTSVYHTTRRRGVTR